MKQAIGSRASFPARPPVCLQLAERIPHTLHRNTLCVADSLPGPPPLERLISRRVLLPPHAAPASISAVRMDGCDFNSRVLERWLTRPSSILLLLRRHTGRRILGWRYLHIELRNHGKGLRRPRWLATMGANHRFSTPRLRRSKLRDVDVDVALNRSA